jgi:uncharacterized protein YunC (DUF1805 family)
MKEQTIKLGNVHARGYVIELGPVNLVPARTSRGTVGCGALNVRALDKFGYPAARAAGRDGAPIVTVEDLLRGTVAETNRSAATLGVTEAMSG